MGKLQDQDVIVAIDGEPVGYTAALQAEIAERHPGDVVTITVYRDGRPVDVDVQLDEAPINTPPPTAAAPTPTGAQRLGIEVEPIDAENAEAYGFSEPGGVVLTDVLPGSAADRRRALTFQGFKLAQINDSDIETPEDVRETLDGADSGDIVSLHFEDREGNQRVLNVRMP
jgi:S1-C subfamily serine protease